MKRGLKQLCTAGIHLLLSLCMGTTQLNAQCVMACLNDEQISLDNNCEAIIAPQMILKSSTTCNGPFTVLLRDADGQILPSSPQVNQSHIGLTLSVEVRDQSSGNFCWGSIRIADKLPPSIACRDTSLPCFASLDSILPIANDACGTVSLAFSDRRIDGSCQDTFTQQITRTWVATDGSGNTASCDMQITLQRIPLDSIQLPPNLDDNEQAALLCEQKETPPGNLPTPRIGWNALPNGHPSPFDEFYPAPNQDIVKWVGSGIPSGGCDDLDFSYQDIRIDICPTGNSDACFKILRRWTITDHCSDSIRTAEQIIKVLDKEAPSIDGLADVTISTDIHECEANWLASTPLLSDNCQSPGELTYDIIQAGDGQILGLAGGQFRISGLSVNTHDIVYRASDCCGNERLDTLQLTVLDQIPPTAVCDQFTQAALTSDGTTKVFARTFDDQSHDNCGEIFLKVIRQQALAGSPNGSSISQEDFCQGIDGDDDPTIIGNQIYFDDFVKFCCDNIGNQQAVVLRVFDVDPGSGPIAPSRMAVGGDLHGRFSDCDAFVEVFDKLPPQIDCPADLTLDCSQDFTDLTLSGRPDARDNCAIDTLFFNDDLSGLSNCNTGEVIRRWTVRDQAGLEAVCTQQITLQDTTAATIIFPPDTTVSCGASMDPDATGRPFTFDDCAQLYINFTDQQFEFPDSCSRKILRHWSVLDWCTGQRFDRRQVIKEFDDLAPELTIPPDVTVQCDAIPPDPIANGMVTATDNCDRAVDIEFVEERIDGDCEDRYQLLRRFTARDNCDNDTTRTQRITVIDQIAPVFSNLPLDQTLECDQAIPPLVNPTATDNCDPMPDLQLREIRLNDPCEDEFRILRTWTATDRCGNSNTVSQLIRFIDSTQPVFSAIPMNMTLECSDPIPPFATPQASDNCDPMPTINMAEVRIDGSCADDFRLQRTWTATDRCGNATTIVQVISFEDTTPPVLQGIPADLTVECLDNSSPVVTATDNCDADVDISFSEVSNGPCDGNNTRVLTWTATDNCGNSSSASQVITLEDTTPPELSGVPADVTVDCNNIPDRIDPVASDTCSGVTLEFEEQIRPGICPDDAIFLRIWTARDGCGNATVDTQRISVIDTLPPVIMDVPNDTTVLCDQVPPPPLFGGRNINVSDNCDDMPDILFSESREDGSCPDEYTLIRQWIAEDNCGNRDSVQQRVSVIDTIGPVISGVPPDLRFECNRVPDPPEIGRFLTATDNCDDDPIITFSADTLAGSCPQEFEIIRMWEATDRCGNVTTASHRIFVSDTTPPTISGVPGDIMSSCDNIPDPDDGSVSVSDNCDGMPTLSMRADTLDGSCLNEFSIQRIWVAEDACGNRDSMIQTIFVSDQQPPVIEGVPNDTTVLCNAIPNLPITGVDITAIDNCLGMPDLEFEADTLDGSCPQEFTILRQWIAEDVCGNRDTMVQRIEVIDTLAPIISGVPADATVSCDAIPMPPDIGSEITAVDNCDGMANIRLEQDSLPGRCEGEYSLQRQWIAEDACGNRDTARQVISVVDNIPPVIDGVPADTTVLCDAVPPPPPIDQVIVATDNCSSNVDVRLEQDTLAGACANERTIRRFWIAEDACGNRDTARQEIAVIDTIPPVLMGIPADTVIECNRQLDLPEIGTDITATDNCDGPTNIEFFSETERGACANEFIELRSWVAIDACGNRDTMTQRISLIDTVPPQFEGIPADTMVQCNAIPDPPVIGRDITASDNCSRIVPIRFSTDTIGGSCAGEFTIVRQWVGRDGCNNRDTVQQRIFVTDDQAPQLDGIPADTSVNCQNVPAVPDIGSEITAIDNCDNMVDISLQVDTLNGRCPNEFTILRLWIAEDDCGNRDSSEQRISVTDNQAPVLEGIPADTIVACNAIPDPPLIGSDITATDNCLGMVDIRFESDTLPGRCIGELTLLRRWIAEDLCGNRDTAVQRIGTIDTIAPVISGVPADTSIICTEAPDFAGIPAGIQVSDDCDPAPSIRVVVDTIGGRCAAEFSIRRFWIAEDDCGNRDTARQFLSLIDTIAPVVLGIPADTTVSCNNVPAPPVIGQDIVGMDSCSDSVDIQLLVDTLAGNCTQEFSIRRRWVVRDDCGNSDTLHQIISVIDTIAPELIVPLPAMGRIENGDSCDVFLPFVATAFDACDSNVQITHNFAGALDPFSTNGDASGDYPLGLTSVVFTATDACGNSTTDSSLVEIVDRFGPVFTCGDLSIMLDPVTLTDTVFPEEIMTTSIDLCSNPTTRFFINTPDPTQIIFTCDDPASSFVFIETADAVGNTLICGARVNIVNKASVCPRAPEFTTDVVGQITDESGMPMQDISVTVSGGMDQEVQSSQAGYFQFEDLEKGYDYEVKPESNLRPLNGVSTYDLVLMSKHILGIEALDSPYKVIAADVNRSGSITAIDMVELRKLILFIDTAFQYTQSWRFLPADYTFNDPEEPLRQAFPEVYNIQALDTLMSDVNFMAIKTGDLNGSARPNQIRASSSRHYKGRALLGLNEQWMEAGQSYQLAIRAKDFPSVHGFQFALEAIGEGLDLVDAEPRVGTSKLSFQEGHLGKRLLPEGVLTVSWSQETAVSPSADEVLFHLTVKARRSAWLSELLQISSDYTMAEAYDANLDLLNLDLGFDKPSNPRTLPGEYQLLQNRPNPFADETIIGFQLPEATAVQLRIFDLSGRLIHQHQAHYQAGQHEWTLGSDELPGSGLYYYQLQCPAFTATRKMTLQK
ncbi:MAG: T9SS type A sorting domain-containing protein [Bacteroidota bacterium]